MAEIQGSVRAEETIDATIWTSDIPSGGMNTRNGILLKDKITGVEYLLYVSEGKLTMTESGE